MSIAPGIKALAIWEDNTPTVFQLNGQQVGIDSPDVAAFTRTTGRGTLKKTGNQSFEWVIRHDDATLHSSMESAAHGTLQWKLLIVGYNSVFFVLDEATFVPEPTPQVDPQSEEFPFQIRYELRAGTQIAQGINGVAAYQRSQGNSLFADDDSDNLADGFTNSGVESPSFSGGVQTLNNSSGAGSFYIDIPFPIEGIIANLAATYTVSSGSPDLVLRFLDSGGSTLSSVTTTITAARKEAEGTTPANTHTLRLLLADDTVAFNITVTDPSLRVDENSTFIDG